MLSLRLSTSLCSAKDQALFNIQSLAFNGTDEYVNVDVAANDINISAGTFSIWAKLNTMSSSGNFMLARYDGDNLLNLLYHASSNEVRFAYRGGASSVIVSLSDAIENDGKWHHIAATWDISADEIKLYLDGALKDTASSLTVLSNTPTEMDIASNTLGGSYFNGNLCQAALFTRVVPIGELFLGRSEPINLTASPNLKAYYEFNLGAGSSAVDSSGTNNTGTLINTPTWSSDVPYKAN